MMIGDIWLTPQMIPDLSDKLGVHPKTVARWLRDRKLPKTVEMLLDITHNGNLGQIHPDWDGWHIGIKDGELVTPIVHRGGRRSYRNRDIFKMQITYQQLSALRSANAELSAKTEGQEKTIEILRTQVADQQRVIERLESRLAELTGSSVGSTGDAAQTRRYGLSGRKPNG